MLLKTLAEQKFASTFLEKLMADQTIELEECRNLVGGEIERRKVRHIHIHTYTYTKFNSFFKFFIISLFFKYICYTTYTYTYIQHRRWRRSYGKQ
jgi:hypothetical protein